MLLGCIPQGCEVIFVLGLPQGGGYCWIGICLKEEVIVGLVLASRGGCGCKERSWVLLVRVLGGLASGLEIFLGKAGT